MKSNIFHANPISVYIFADIFFTMKTYCSMKTYCGVFEVRNPYTVLGGLKIRVNIS